MNKNTENFFDRIDNRLGPANAAQPIATLHRAGIRGEVGSTAVSEAAELVARYKLEARSAIHHYRVWQTAQAARKIMEPSREEYGRMLLRQAQAASALLFDAKRDYNDLVELSIAHCDEQAMAKLKADKREAAND